MKRGHFSAAVVITYEEVDDDKAAPELGLSENKAASGEHTFSVSIEISIVDCHSLLYTQVL